MPEAPSSLPAPDPVSLLGDHTTATFSLNVAKWLLHLGGGLFLTGAAVYVVLDYGLSLCSLAVFAAAGIYGALLLAKALSNSHLRVQIYPHGFTSLRHGKLSVCRWDQIEAVWKTEERQVHMNKEFFLFTAKCFLTVNKQDGERIYLSDFLNHIQALGETIIEESYRHLWPKAAAAYQGGETVVFGPLAVSTTGLTYRGRALPWSEVKSILITADFIKVIQKGSWLGYWADLPSSAIPNFSVMWTLLENTGLIVKP